VLRKLEGLTFLVAMLLVIVVEGAWVYWIFGHSPMYATAGRSLNVVGAWTGLALPQGWLLGAVLVLIYRLVPMFIPPARWTDRESSNNRRAFLRLWRLAIAMVSMQALLLFLDKAATS
jgi:hypothetical protein